MKFDLKQRQLVWENLKHLKGMPEFFEARKSTFDIHFPDWTWENFKKAVDLALM